MTPDECRACIQALDWEGLRVLWRQIQEGDTPGWDRGSAFEYLVLRAFELDGAVVRFSFQAEFLGTQVEQIDGAIHLGNLSAIVESKDHDANLPFGPIAKLRSQLLRRPAGTLGILFSRTGFTEQAKLLCHFTMPQAILLWSGDELEHCLEPGAMVKALTVKRDRAIEEGLPFFDVGVLRSES
jgi:hypothetical protein